MSRPALVGRCLLLCVALALQGSGAHRNDEDDHHLLAPESFEQQAEEQAGMPGAGRSFTFLNPEPKDLRVVQQFAELLAGNGAEGAEASAKVAANPGSAALLLQDLAGKRRLASDVEDRDSQFLQHILELHFQVRADSSGASLSRGLIWQLAEDVRRLNKLDAMSEADLAAIPDEEVDNFVAFFRGRMHWKPKLQLPSGALALAETGNAEQTEISKQKRVVVFSCSFGDGHRSAATALQGHLKEGGYNVIPVDTTNDPRFKDWLQKELGANLGDMWYNGMVLKWELYPLQNFFEQVRSMFMGSRIHKPCPSPRCNTAMKDKFRAVLLESRPDLIVTVYHMDLLPILEVATDLGNIPVLHIATDIDLKMSEVFGEGPSPIYPRFKVAMPFPGALSRQTAVPLRPDRTFLSGYPVRQPFLLPKDNELVRRERAKLAPLQTKVVLVMTGGGGQDVPWPELLATKGVGIPLHVLVIVGRNEAIKTRLHHSLGNSAEFADGRVVLQGRNPKVTVEVATENGSTYISPERLALLMDVADAIITKPGGGTTSEVAYRGLPAVFDATHGLLHWEEFTVHTFEQHGRGERFLYAEQLPEVLLRALKRDRSLSMVEDPEAPGHVLNAGPRVLAEAKRLIEMPCQRCRLFPPLPS